MKLRLTEKIVFPRLLERSISFPTFTSVLKQTVDGIRVFLLESSIKITFSSIFIEQTELVVPKSIPRHFCSLALVFGSSILTKFILI